jgi:hypothetical protein
MGYPSPWETDFIPYTSIKVDASNPNRKFASKFIGMETDFLIGIELAVDRE